MTQQVPSSGDPGHPAAAGRTPQPPRPSTRQGIPHEIPVHKRERMCVFTVSEKFRPGKVTYSPLSCKILPQLRSIMPVNYTYRLPAIIRYTPYVFMDKNCAPAGENVNDIVHLWMAHQRLYNYCKTCHLNPSPRLYDKTMHGPDESHGYTCPCSDCQSKYGSLPVLLEGIESQQSDEPLNEPLNLSTASTAGHTATSSTPEGDTKTEPSTSGLKHTRRKEIKCSECEKVFTHRGDYNKHLRKHSGEKPYECSVCKKMFSHTSNLTRHLKVHSGHRPFECENCGKTFARKDKLEAHMTTRICRKRALVKNLSQ